MKLIRGIIGIIVGLILISIVVEGIELLLVTLASNGSPPIEDPVAYAEIRNQPTILLLKLIYTAFGAVVGGYVTTWISHRPYGIALAILQTAILIGALFFTELGEITPMWMRVAIVIITFFGILAGMYFRQRIRLNKQQSQN